MPGKSPSFIHGTTDSEITPEQILSIGETIGMQYKEVAVGYNTHNSSEMVLSSLMAGLTSTGANVRNAGIIPSPVIPFASKEMECCLMIGNHDDRSKISGITLMNNDGRFFNDAQMFAFTNRLNGEKILRSYDKVGSISHYTSAAERYIDTVLEFIDPADCQMIIDCASDSSATVVPDIMSAMGTDAIIASCQTELDSSYLWAGMEYGNTRGLIKLVKANNGSIGIALNMDGSRMILIDELGRPVSGESVLQIMLNTLKPKKVALPIDISSASKDLVDGALVLTPVGSENLGESMKKDELDFGGDADGSFIFKNISYATDGITAAAIIAGIAAEGNISKMVDELPKFERDEKTIPFAEDREIVAEEISNNLSDIEYDELYTVDGWRAEMENGWFLIRFSDYSDSVDIKVEGTDKMYVAGLMEIAQEIVTSAIKASI